MIEEEETPTLATDTPSAPRRHLASVMLLFAVLLVFALGGWALLRPRHPSYPPPIEIGKARAIAEACIRLFDLPREDDDISPNDERMPEEIQALHPREITIMPEDVVIMTSGKPAEYHLTRREGAAGPQILYVSDADYNGEHREAIRLPGKK